MSPVFWYEMLFSVITSASEFAEHAPARLDVRACPACPAKERDLSDDEGGKKKEARKKIKKKEKGKEKSKDKDKDKENKTKDNNSSESNVEISIGNEQQNKNNEEKASKSQTC